uniref:Protocadherin gamma-C3 n=1 Tax=Callorhinchus milii TaxID=7868 RepID=B0YN55_CALMI|nr:protocadherin delta1 [Callorhinchus milii]|eukprot:gi/632967762/ref/XP_007900160.1/ PREDICTED: protocadherin-10-like [Callorhinchus milii]
MANSNPSRILDCCLAFLFLSSSGLWGSAFGQIRYSIREELEHGAFVGNIADDLGLNVAELSARRFRIVSGARQHYLDVNLENGILFVNEKIDREQLCGLNPTCFLNLEVVIENPLELYQAEIEILDVNDNYPSFPQSQVRLDITESATPGARFPLESAHDPDVGPNSLRTYRLTPNEHFILDVHARSERSMLAELILEKALDREQKATHHLVLTAIDGGIPEKSGTAQITGLVTNANDNTPVFDQTVYSVRLVENAPKGTLVLKLEATDLDQGTNGEIVYAFSNHAHQRVRELFSVNPRTGEIRVRGLVDYEEAALYEIFVQAKDKGQNAVAAHCNVMVEIIDLNDNPPEVILTSLSTPVPEDSLPGTVIALINVMDRDSGANGRVSCKVAKNIPFKLLPSFKKYYTLVTDDLLDRESVAEYNITITAGDMGTPSLSSNKTIVVQVSDVNDNTPRFTQLTFTVYVTENNAPGASICSVSAVDPDLNQNSYLFYSILSSQIQGMSVSTYVSINSDTGNIYALRSFDYEQLKSFQIQVQAQDAGFPSLSSNVTVNVFVLDQNDNGPVIVSPLPPNGSVAVERVPRSADTGYLVVKVTAVDADAGQNARLSYRLLQATDSGLFSVALYTGEIRTVRRFGDQDSVNQRLVIQAKDNGQPPLSSTMTIALSIVDIVPEIQSDVTRDQEPHTDLTLYLIISLGSISFLFLVAIVILAAIRCHRDRNNLREAYTCSPVPCCRSVCFWRRKSPREIYQKKANNNLQIASGTKAAPNCAEVGGSGSQAYCYRVCLTPESAKSDFMFLKPYAPATAPPPNNTQPSVTGRSGQTPNPTKPRTNPTSQMKPQNTDCRFSPFQNNLPISSLDQDVLVSRRPAQTEPVKVRSVVSTPTENYRGTPLLVDKHGWTPRYGPQYPYIDQPTGYKHNVYIPGTATLKSCKMDPVTEMDQSNTFSTFGKKRKHNAVPDMQVDRTLN